MDIKNHWFVSDFHFNHYWVNKIGEERGVVLFERHQFSDIREHDEYIIKQLREWACQHVGDVLWILGDFGDVGYLWIIDELRYKYFITVNFVWGNHDKKDNYDRFVETFNNVYLYPMYINNRIVVSHEPVYPCPSGVVNIHGHLHASVLDSPQHMNASIHIIHYQPFSGKKVEKQLSVVEKANFKFLHEAYADKYVFTQDKEDAVYDETTGKINLAASLALQKLRKQKKEK